METSGKEFGIQEKVNYGEYMFKLFQEISGIDRVLSATDTDTDTETETGVKFYRIIGAMYKTGQ